MVERDAITDEGGTGGSTLPTRRFDGRRLRTRAGRTGRSAPFSAEKGAVDALRFDAGGEWEEGEEGEGVLRGEGEGTD